MILVTGGAGFIGTNFIRSWLAASDEPVINLDRLTYAGTRAGLEDLPDDRHCFVEGDIADRQLVDHLLAHYRPRALINFAAETHVDNSIRGPQAFIDANIVGVFHLLEAARHYYQTLPMEQRDAFRFLQISTDEVYGDLAIDALPVTEQAPYRPSSPYAAAKASADHLVRAYHRTYGLPIMISHCSNNYGPYQYPEKLIPLMLRRALAGQPMPVYGDGQQQRDWLHVEDHCAAVRRILACGGIGESYNIGTGKEIDNLSLVNHLCSRLDELKPRADGGSYRQQITFVADRPGHDRRYALDIRKATTQLGWKPQWDFSAGLEQTIQWYLGHPAYLARSSAGTEGEA